MGSDRGHSAELIERRDPGLRVVSVGDPEWVTPEKYSEILNSWIPASLHFDLGNPTGWLRDSDDALSRRSDPSS
ncbi:MAG: hypothetical protein ACR2OB_00110 [Solirubrobacteraceae bacterium]